MGQTAPTIDLGAKSADGKSVIAVVPYVKPNGEPAVLVIVKRNADGVFDSTLDGQPALAFADSVLWREFGLAAQSKSYGVCMRRSHCGEFLLLLQQSATAMQHGDAQPCDRHELRWNVDEWRCG